jgi:hypothetical protein
MTFRKGNKVGWTSDDGWIYHGTVQNVSERFGAEVKVEKQNGEWLDLPLQIVAIVQIADLQPMVECECGEWVPEARWERHDCYWQRGEAHHAQMMEDDH